MINKYTNTEATKFLGCEPCYGYHTTIYETGDFKTSRFSVEIKEYRHDVLLEVKFLGHTPLGAAGPHGFSLSIPKTGDWVNRVEEISTQALNLDFSKFPNPTQYNRSVSISGGENNVRTWVADCGDAQTFAEKCFQLNTK
jgi:hypothetical protein